MNCICKAKTCTVICNVCTGHVSNTCKHNNENHLKFILVESDQISKIELNYCSII